MKDLYQEQLLPGDSVIFGVSPDYGVHVGEVEDIDDDLDIITILATFPHGFNSRYHRKPWQCVKITDETITC